VLIERKRWLRSNNVADLLIDLLLNPSNAVDLYF
jgi:hypothetical protein